MIEGQFNIDQTKIIQEPSILEESGIPVRRFEHAIGNVVLTGHCLSPDEEVVEVLDKAVASKEEKLVTFLSGSYAAIVSKLGKTTVYSDLAGQFPVYFTRQTDKVHYSTSLERVAPYASGMPDKVGLALELTGAHTLNQTRTRYASIYRLPAAQKLELSSENVQMSPYEFFAPTNRTFAEAAEDVRIALRTAIAGRLALGRTISGDFSGGMDSTSLAFLTLAQLPPEAQFHAFHSYFPNTTAGDLRYAQKYAGLDRRISLHLVELPVHQYNFSPGEPLRPIYTQYSHIQDVGSELHLNGTGSDALFNIAPAYLYDMWHQEGAKGASRLLRATIAQARLANANPLEYIHKVSTKPADKYKDIIHDSSELLKKGEIPKELDLLSISTAIAALSISMRQKLATGLVIDDFVRADIGRADRMALHELWASGRAANIARDEAQQKDVAMHFPFLDHQVIRASLQIAAHKRHDYRQFKALLRAALDGEVPAELLQRRSKGSYSSEAFADIRINAQNFRDTLDSKSFLARLGMVDLQTIHQTITEAELGLRGAVLDLPVRAVEIEQWLQSKYHLPPVSTNSYKPSTIETGPTMPSFPVSLAPHARAIEDHAGVALYNLQTSELRALHHAAAAVVRVLHEQGHQENIYEAVSRTLKPEQQHQAKALAANILATLLDRGFLEPESSRPFSITIPQDQPHAQASEVFYTENIAHSSEVKISDYLAMVSGIYKARKLLDNSDMHAVAQRLKSTRNDQQWSCEPRVKRLLLAGHVIGRYYVNRLACQELSLAVVLAEAQRNKRVDWALGISADPRGVHAWPEIDGKSIRTEHDDVVSGKYVKIDAW